MGVAVLTSSDAAWAWSTTGGVNTIIIEALGGGGAGTYCAGNPIYGGGGKGGSYAKKTITKGAETTLNITVGAGGTAASAGSTTDGAASTVVQVATTVLSAAGGKSVAQDSGTGATAIVGTNTGDLTYEGGNGSNFTGTSSGGGGGASGPTSVGGAASGTTAGAKGSGTFLNDTIYSGNGGTGVVVRNVGNPGQASFYGGAGSGGSTNQAADKAGGAGVQGVVVITWTAAGPTMPVVMHHLKMMRG